MRTGWLVGVIVLASALEAEADPAPKPPVVMVPRWDSRDVVTKKKPTAAEIVTMLELDPAHEKVTARELRGMTLWDRSYDGIPVLVSIKTFEKDRQWHTLFRMFESRPAPVRRAELLTSQAAIEKARTQLGLLDKPVAELRYRLVYQQEEVPGPPSKDGTEYVRTVVRFDLVYVVHRRDEDVPAVILDAYRGTIVTTVAPTY